MAINRSDAINPPKICTVILGERGEAPQLGQGVGKMSAVRIYDVDGECAVSLPKKIRKSGRSILHLSASR